MLFLNFAFWHEIFMFASSTNLDLLFFQWKKTRGTCQLELFIRISLLKKGRKGGGDLRTHILKKLWSKQYGDRTCLILKFLDVEYFEFYE